MTLRAPNPTAAVLLIGDEILSGQTQDTNMRTISRALGPLGIEVKEARVVADDHQVIIDAVKALSSAYTYVFTTGGIGPTHDDITADAVAAAFDRSIGVRDDARAILHEWYLQKQVELTPARLRMARIPDGADLIHNEVSAAPGFRLDNVHVMAGVPKIMSSMLDNVLSTLTPGVPQDVMRLRVDNLPEGDIAPGLAEISQAHPTVSIGSYPGPIGNDPPFIKLSARSRDPLAVKRAIDDINDLVNSLGLSATVMQDDG